MIFYTSHSDISSIAKIVGPVTFLLFEIYFLNNVYIQLNYNYNSNTVLENIIQYFSFLLEHSVHTQTYQFPSIWHFSHKTEIYLHVMVAKILGYETIIYTKYLYRTFSLSFLRVDTEKYVYKSLLS